MKYLVMGTEAGYFRPRRSGRVLSVVIPADELRILRTGDVVGGLPVGDRAFVFVAEADSRRSRPDAAVAANMGRAGVEVPLQDFEARARRKEYSRI
jgi:hypothetical protein